MKKLKLIAQSISLMMLLQSATLAWEPPIGIPRPSFGIEETYRMYDDPANRNPQLTYHQNAEGGYYTHYIDNTHPAATDTGNPFGTVHVPRKSVPQNLPAGSVAEVHADVIPNNRNGYFFLTGTGTAERPIFVRGVGSPSLSFGCTIGFPEPTSYFVVEGIGFTRGGVTTPSDETVFNTAYISIRNCDFAGTESSGGFSVTSSGSNFTEYVVFYNNTVHDAGIWDRTDGTDPDIGNIHAGTGAGHVWFVDNEAYHIDSTAFGVAPYPQNITNDDPYCPHAIYFGRNIAHHNRQGGFWTKTGRDIIFSQNIAYNNRQIGLGFQYDPKRLWFLCNTSYDNQDAGFDTGSGFGNSIRSDIYLLGNVIHDNPIGMELNALNMTDHAVIAGNTINKCPQGISNGYYTVKVNIINNIIANYTHAIDFGSEYISYQVSDMSYNLFDGSGDIVWGAEYANASELQLATGSGIQCIEADPMFVDPANNDFHLQEGSPAIDTGTSSGIVQEVFDRFEQLYGIDIGKDIEGGVRPYGSAWDIGAYEWGSTPADPDSEHEPDTDTEPAEEPEALIPDVTGLVVMNNILKSGSSQSASIRCNMKESGKLIVKIYDAKGKEIITICDEQREAGRNEFVWAGLDSSGSAVGSGIYIVHLKSGEYSETKKIAIIK